MENNRVDLLDLTCEYWSNPPLLTEAINLAAKHGHVAIINWLVAHGADVNYETETQNPLRTALVYGHIDAANVIAGFGATLANPDNHTFGQLNAWMTMVADDGFTGTQLDKAVASMNGI